MTYDCNARNALYTTLQSASCVNYASVSECIDSVLVVVLRDLSHLKFGRLMCHELQEVA